MTVCPVVYEVEHMAPPEKDVEAYERLRSVVRDEFGQFCPLREPEFDQLKKDVVEIKTTLAGINAANLASCMQDNTKGIAANSSKIGRIYAGITVVMFVIGISAAVFFTTIGGMIDDLNDIQANNASMATLLQEHLRTHPDTQLRIDFREDLHRIELRLDGLEDLIRSNGHSDAASSE